MREGATETGSDLEALERFVVENDDLFALEEAIGRFNIFDALRIERAEIRHSNFLAWLLSPNESHGQGDLFLKAVLMDVLRRSRAEGRTPPVSLVLLDGIELHEIEIRREWRNIDLLVVSREPAFVVAIENKVDSGEHSNQLNRYEEIVRAEFASMPSLFVFLSARGHETGDEDWLDYSYQALHGVLMRVRRTAAGSLGVDVGTFLDHYLSLIGSRFMTDTKIEELCRRIYSNHRAAIDLINRHAPVQGSEAATALREHLRGQKDRWTMRSAGPKILQFVPAAWVGAVSTKDGTPGAAAACDFFIEAEAYEQVISVRLVLGPGSDLGVRARLFETLTKPPYGLQKKGSKTLTDTWTRLQTTKLCSWSHDDRVPTEKIGPAFDEWVARIAPALDDIPKLARRSVGG